ncbi:MAG: hypothetical protein FJ279_35400, partial [Planctomycetes bacterium]|nr:hypothetical protein [Planctomycetota bacterium]
ENQNQSGDDLPDSTELVGTKVGDAKTSVGQDSPAGKTNTAIESTEVPTGTAAFIGQDTVVAAGDDVNVRAKAQIKLNSATGSVALGAVGIGGAVTVATIRGHVQAYLDERADVKAGADEGDDVLVTAELTDALKGRAGAGEAGIVALGAQVAVINDASEQRAYVANGATVGQAGGTVTIQAKADRNVRSEATGGQIGHVAAGAAVARSTANAATQAHVDGTLSNVRYVNILADAVGEADAEALAVSAGIAAGVGTDARAEMSPTVRAYLSGTGRITARRDVTISATATPHADAEADGVSAGAVSVGVSLATAEASPDIQAWIAGGTSVTNSVALEGDPSLTFADGRRNAGDVVATMSGDPSLDFTHSDDGAGSILNTITRSAGNWRDDGFRSGQLMDISGTASNNGRYRITGVGDTELLVEETLTGETSDTADAVGYGEGYDTVQRDAGDWRVDGFAADEPIQITGSDRNDGDYTVKRISDDGRTLFLDAHGTLKSEMTNGVTVQLDPESAGDVTVKAAQTVPADDVSVRADSRAAGGGLISVNATKSTAKRDADLTAYVGDNASLDVQGTLTVSARTESKQWAGTTGKHGGIIAVGHNPSKAWSD